MVPIDEARGVLKEAERGGVDQMVGHGKKGGSQQIDKTVNDYLLAAE